MGVEFAKQIWVSLNDFVVLFVDPIVRQFTSSECFSRSGVFRCKSSLNKCHRKCRISEEYITYAMSPVRLYSKEQGRHLFMR